MITMVQEVVEAKKKEIFQLDRGQSQTDFDSKCLGGNSFFPPVPPRICSVFHLVVLELNLYDNNGLGGGGGQKKEIYQLDRLGLDRF